MQMTDTPEIMPSDASSKKPYSQPALIEYGDINKVTLDGEANPDIILSVTVVL